MPYKLAIFDLDGTLADSFPWFIANVNAVADRFRFRRVDPGEVEGMRHSPPREILAHLQVPAWKVPLIARHVRRLKAEHISSISLFPGVGSMLETLSRSGMVMAMVSSDSEQNVRRALGDDHAGLMRHYSCGASLYGKARKFRRVLKQTGIPPGETIAIGDEVRDIEAARATGIAFGAVTWGYMAPEALRAYAPEHIFNTMDDIVRRLSR